MHPAEVVRIPSRQRAQRARFREQGVKSFVATTGLGDPFVPVPMSNSMSSVSKRALGPKRTKRSRGRSSSVIPLSTSLVMIAQRRVRLSQTP